MKGKQITTEGEIMDTHEIKPQVFLRTPYNYNTDQASQASGLACMDESRAKQSFKEECDINTIVERFGITYQMPAGIEMPNNQDFSEVEDFHTAMNAIAKSREAFEKLPADLRYRFHNNPAEFVDFCSDDNNRTEAEKWGLVQPKTPEKVSVGPVTSSNELVPGTATTGANATGGQK